MAIILYGIPNCDQVRKARAWLNDHALSFDFHDFKKAGIERSLIETWLIHLTWDVLLNKKGTTWRNLSDQRKAAITDAKSATELMLELPSAIKRPVLSIGESIHVGFSDPLYQQIFKK
ncbi:MAG: arsenate reductase [Burkholderiales bacterium RIFCSPLOWO2_02_FULL_57_36]|nr:MAG: arsenate reductase [Burkholderiales bacterium RIFCSPLOWO2_02_FULL_57_36]